MKLDYHVETIVLLIELNQSHNKIRNILKSYINIRTIKDFRQINDIYKISKSIHYV